MSLAVKILALVKAIGTLAATLPQQAVFSFEDGLNCPLDLPFTCTNSTPVLNSCCFEYPGGVFLQTQFWDYAPAIGGNETFTLHGLWPDKCDGTYEQFCDNGLDVRNVTKILLDQFNDTSLYQKMKRDWKNFNGNDEELWIHEFNKHATCVKTIRPSCYDAETYIENLNVYEFFNTTYGLYEELPTFKFLKDEGIVPSNSKTYSKQEIDHALEKHFGNKVYFKCRGNALQEVWYFHHLRGSLRGKEFRRIDSLMSSSCPETGIRFVPKQKGGRFPKPPPDALAGFLKLTNHNGCIISNGQLYLAGTCATFHIADLQFGGVSLKSSKGYCDINEEGDLSCLRAVNPKRAQFQIQKASGELSYGGEALWCLDYEKLHGTGKFKQIPLKLSDSSCDSFKLIFGSK